jgi:hypothetical protein
MGKFVEVVLVGYFAQVYNNKPQFQKTLACFQIMK